MYEAMAGSSYMITSYLVVAVCQLISVPICWPMALGAVTCELGHNSYVMHRQHHGFTLQELTMVLHMSLRSFVVSVFGASDADPCLRFDFLSHENASTVRGKSWNLYGETGHV